MQYSEELLTFLKDPEIQHALNNMNFEYVFEQITTSVASTTGATKAKLWSDIGRLLMKLGLPFLHGIETIPEYLFSWHKKLKRIKIPQNITRIDNCAFYGCKNLQEVILPDGLKEIGPYVFYGCTSLTTLTIPESIKVIGSNAFGHCTNLHVKIPQKFKTSMYNTGLSGTQIEFY